MCITYQLSVIDCQRQHTTVLQSYIIIAETMTWGILSENDTTCTKNSLNNDCA